MIGRQMPHRVGKGGMELIGREMPHWPSHWLQLDVISRERLITINIALDKIVPCRPTEK